MPDLNIPTPCHEPWEAMSPAERGRRCSVCSTTVVDLVEAGPREARSRLAAAEAKVRTGERVCVRAHTDWSGRLLSPGVRRHLLTNGLAAIVAMAAAGCYAEEAGTGGGCGGSAPTDASGERPKQEPQDGSIRKEPARPPVVGMIAPPRRKPDAKPATDPHPEAKPDQPQPAPQAVTTGQLVAPPRE